MFFEADSVFEEVGFCETVSVFEDVGFCETGSVFSGSVFFGSSVGASGGFRVFKFLFGFCRGIFFGFFGR